MDSAGADTDRVSSGSLATTAARVVVVVAGAFLGSGRAERVERVPWLGAR